MKQKPKLRTKREVAAVGTGSGSRNDVRQKGVRVYSLERSNSAGYV